LSALSELIVARSEELGVEYKAWMDTSANDVRAKLAKHIVALANHGGGYLIFGVDDTTRLPMAETELARALFSQDAIAGIVRRYLDPRLQVRVEDVPYEGVVYPVLVVPSHAARPVVAIADGPQDDRGRPVGIRQGEIYIRAAGPESVAIRSPDDWNALLERCLVHRADLIGNIVRQSMAPTIRRPSAPVEDLLLAAVDSTADDFVAQTAVLSTMLDPARAVHVHEAARSFSALGYGLIGADGDLLALDSLRSLNERVAVSMNGYANNGWVSFMPFTRPEIAPQIRMGELGGRTQSYLEGMRLPSTNLIAGAFDYWRIYEAGIAVTVESYREDPERLRAGGPPFLALYWIMFRLHSILAHARLVGQEVPGLQQVLVRLDWRGLANRMLMWDAHRYVTPSKVVDDRFVKTVVLTWPELRDSYFEAFRKVTLPLLDVFPSAGWHRPNELVTRSVVEREFARFQSATVRLFDD
jgi:hypothetical protein